MVCEEAGPRICILRCVPRVYHLNEQYERFFFAGQSCVKDCAHVILNMLCRIDGSEPARVTYEAVAQASSVVFSEARVMFNDFIELTNRDWNHPSVA